MAMPGKHTYQIGERVICRVRKWSTHPGPRAKHVRPEVSGEGYQYEVDKYWAVLDVRDDEIVLITRRGKMRAVDPSDPALRPATWWEQFAYRDRFPTKACAMDVKPA